MNDASNTWKLQNAKAQFSELVRRARAGEPQHVTVHGKQAVVIFDPARFELSPRANPQGDQTMAGFLERTKRYNLNLDVEFDRPVYMRFPTRHFGKPRSRRR
jgi:prevent-host-death family protein